MASMDNVAWLALAVALTAVGLGASFLAWRRRGVAAGLRGLAWSLLPMAAYLTGTLRLAGRLIDSVSSWAVGLVFSPLVWIGLGLAGTSVVLFVVAGRLRRREPNRTAPDRRRRALPREPHQQPAETDDMADIEAILKRHGIS